MYCNAMFSQCKKNAKKFSQLLMLITFLNIFLIDFARWKSVELPHIAYIVIH